MMLIRSGTKSVLITLVGLLAAVPAVSAQLVPWTTYLDLDTGAECGVINAANAELVVLSATGELVIITGPDRILGGTFVDDNLSVFFGCDADLNCFPGGFIDYDFDGDGELTLWWMALNGTVFDVDEFTGAPLTTDLRPYDFLGSPCDPCVLWDDQDACFHDDDDDIIIIIDDDDIVVIIDDDDDNPGTITISLCGMGVPASFGMTMVGLMFMGLTRRSRFLG